MSRQVRRAARRTRLAAAVVLAVALAGVTAHAQESASPAPRLEVRPPARALLVRIQAGWLDWLTAMRAGDVERAAEVADSILALVRPLDLERLPQLAIAAAVQAATFARDGKLELAEHALEAAERFDPGRPETRFAAARVAWAGGRRVAAARAQLAGAWRLVDLHRERAAALRRATSWSAVVLLVLAFVFIALAMVARGPRLYADLTRALSRVLPGALSIVAAWAVLLWPLLLPEGPVWLALYWSVLLWAEGGRAERVLHIAAWLVIAFLPALLALQSRDLRLAETPGLWALAGAADGRLEGRLFSDVDTMSAELPRSVALAHARADLSRKLDQCDQAVLAYQEVLDSEPENVSALNDLGACQLVGGLVERSIDSFRQAVAAGGDRAEIHYNLSQAHAELYQFFESEEALRRARAIDSSEVSSWLLRDRAYRTVALDGGLDRTPGLRRELAIDRGAPRAAGAGLSAALVGALLLAAGTLQLLVRRPQRPLTRQASAWLPSFAEAVRRALLPGVPEAEQGHWGRALLAAAAATALFIVLVAPEIGPAVPWGLDPGPWLVRGLGLAGLVALVGVRLILARGEGR